MGGGDMELLPGDIVLTRSKGFVGWLIRQFTRTTGEKRTKVNHCGVMVDGDHLVEALSKVFKNDLRQRYRGGRAQIAIYRWKGLTEEELQTVGAKAHSYVGRGYGWTKILAHAMDRMFGGVYWFRRLARMDKYPICSWVVAYAYHTIGKGFGVEPNAADPDHIWDYCEEEETRAQFEKIFPLGKLP